MSRQGAFSVPFSSSPPSTPGSRRSNTNIHENHSESYAANPSTTPAGPPPSSARSFTPAGPPPTSVFGSSQLGTGSTRFKVKGRTSPGFKSVLTRKDSPSQFRSSKLASIGRLGKSGNTRSKLQYSTVSDAEYETTSGEDIDDDEPAEVDDEHDEASEDGDMDVDSHEGDNDLEQEEEEPTSHTKDFKSSDPYNWAQHGSSVNGGMLESAQISHRGTSITNSQPQSGDVQLVVKKVSAFPTIAKDLARQMEPAQLDESDELIVETERLVEELYPKVASTDDAEQVLASALTVIPDALCKLWQSCCNQGHRKSNTEMNVGIGPGENDPSLSKANFLCSLLLKLHHPPASKGKQAFAVSRAKFPSRLAGSFHPTEASARPQPYPKVLLDWLEHHHNPYPTATIDVQGCHPNATAHPNYWDVIFSAILRGRFSEVIRVLRDSDFTHARTASEDGPGANGYRGAQLSSIVRVMNKAIRILESCPALIDENWEVTGNDWAVFRRRVEQAISDLAAFAEGRDRDLDPPNATFQAENFGMKGTSDALSRSTRRAESKVPWTVYQNLKAMYGLLLGGTTEIISVAQDWAEATIGLAVWWDGDDDDEVAVGSLAMTRRSLRRSQSRIPRSVDIDSQAAYFRRLAYSFERVTDTSDEESFQVDSMNSVEVGLASIFEGNVEGTIALLRGWSLPVTAAVMEIATQANWNDFTPGTDVADDFDESDLMVLSYGQPEKSLSRDGVLLDYAEEISHRERIHDPRFKSYQEGWELSIEILNRLDNNSLADQKVGEMLGRLPLNSDMRTDKLIGICRNFGLVGDASNIAERYADSIAEHTDNYGTALMYYARAHNSKKVKSVLDLLISLSLVQSLAYPPISTIDENLRALINHPRRTILDVAALDPEAAEILQFYLAGYATVRKFYGLRDEEVHLQEGHKPSLRPVARKKAAAAALLTVIASAADGIQGGLFDGETESVVQVDGLLTLLGEATVFVDQSTAVLILPQLLALLTAIEDLETIHPAIYRQCEDCFTATLAASLGLRRPASTREMMKKSISSLTASSGFSLVGSEMLDGGDDDFGVESASGLGGGSSAGDRKQKVKGSSDVVKRGWDWRAGMEEGATGKDILRTLRLGLARDVARAWMNGEKV